MNFGRVKAAKWLVAALVCGFFLPIQTTPVRAAAIGDTDQALVLNGTSQYASVADGGSHPFNVTGSLTMEAWVLPTSACTNDQFIIDKYVAYSLYCGSSGYWKYAISGDGVNWTGVTTGIRIVPNAWQHIAFTHVSGTTTGRFYFNGQFAETETVNIPTTIGTNTNPFYIGTYPSINYFQGSVDEVRIYNTAHSDSQILQDMTNYGPTNASDLVAYYDFNNQSGATVVNVDASPLANTNLTLTGSPIYSNIETTSIVNGDQVVTFPRTYLDANGGWRIPTYTSTVKSLVVAGGGAGGGRAGGGGGAGGYVYDASLAVSPNSIQSIVVGQGGFGMVQMPGSNGTNSSLGSLRNTLGGGGGGMAKDTNDVARVGRDGGSGGGASGSYLSPPASASIGNGLQFSTYGYGSGTNGGGGNSVGNWPSGGGGGASTAGGNGNTSTNVGGKGGNGYADPIAGTTTCYATGGGGGINAGYTPGSGGDCGNGFTANNDTGTAGLTFPGFATANTGAGGGGAGFSGGSDPAGGYGASGVIILRYPLNMSVTVSYSGGTSATYRTSGTITATTTLAGKVTFYDHGKAIPGCKNVATNGSNVATCTWKPSLHGTVTLAATAKPSNTYVSNGSGYLNLTVGARGTTR